MAREPNDRHNSVLDRLIDRDPKRTRGGAADRAQSVRAAAGRAAARPGMAAEYAAHAERPADEAYPEVRQSLYNYGLPDLNALNWESSRDRTRLARTVQEIASHIFEPRLRGHPVVPLEPVAARLPHIMRFQIEGLLRDGSRARSNSFDTTLQLTSGEYQVKGEHECGMTCCSTTSAS